LHCPQGVICARDLGDDAGVIFLAACLQLLCPRSLIDRGKIFPAGVVHPCLQSTGLAELRSRAAVKSRRLARGRTCPEQRQTTHRRDALLCPRSLIDRGKIFLAGVVHPCLQSTGLAELRSRAAVKPSLARGRPDLARAAARLSSSSPARTSQQRKMHHRFPCNPAPPGRPASCLSSRLAWWTEEKKKTSNKRR